MRMPDVGGVMSMLISKDTPNDAPPVRKMCAGSEGYPSRSIQHQPQWMVPKGIKTNRR